MTIYVFVDKSLTVPQQVVQACHSILESKTVYEGEHPYVIVFGIKSSKMHKVKQDLESNGIECTAFYEPDVDYKLTAFCTKPMERHEYMRKFQLLS